MFVTSTLTTGGAEMMLWKLLKELPRKQFLSTVVSLGPVGRPAELMRSAGIEVIELGLPRLGRILRAPSTAYQLIRRVRPQLIQGWMYHGNLVAWALAALTGFRTRLAWSIRQSLYDLQHEKRLTRAVIRLNARLSSRPERIVYVSDVSRQQHEALGFCPSNACVIPNGFDPSHFCRNHAQRAQLRARLKIADAEVLVGHLARFHPMKDQMTLLQAGVDIVRLRPNVKFVLAGRGLDSNNTSLTNALGDNELSTRILLLGEITDPASLLSACDLFCLSSSWGEGFPNALGEAMACEVPAVVTRIGECERIVGDCGLVVEPRNRDAIVSALLQLIDLGSEARASLGKLARSRIIEKYSLANVAARYESLYQNPSCNDATIDVLRCSHDTRFKDRR